MHCCMHENVVQQIPSSGRLYSYFPTFFLPFLPQFQPFNLLYKSCFLFFSGFLFILVHSNTFLCHSQTSPFSSSTHLSNFYCFNVLVSFQCGPFFHQLQLRGFFDIVFYSSEPLLCTLRFPDFLHITRFWVALMSHRCLISLQALPLAYHLLTHEVRVCFRLRNEHVYLTTVTPIPQASTHFFSFSPSPGAASIL